MRFCSGPRGWVALSGVENGPAGADLAKALVDTGQGGNGQIPIDQANSFSFCVDGKTFTAFEDPEDGYRSSLAFLIERAGNHCAVKFQAVALSPSCMERHGPDGEIREAEPIPEDAEVMELHLLHPATLQTALCVGTGNFDDYYPYFIGRHDPQVLEQAKALDLVLAHDLKAELPPGAASSARRI